MAATKPSALRTDIRQAARRSRSVSTPACAALAAVTALGLAACGSSGSGSSSAGTLNVPVFSSFSGADAAIGSVHLAGCLTGTRAVNAAGGVLGHQLHCTSVNATSDPADAVPAANKMLTSISNIPFMIGPGEVAPSTAPIISAAKIPMISAAGDPIYDHNTDPYFYRIVASDSLTGKTMAWWAASHGYKRAASVFTTDPGAQTVPGPLATEYRKLGGTIIKSFTLAPDQSSYRTEAAQIAAAHPQVIFTETDPQTAATFWSEVLGVAGHLPPIIGDEQTTLQSWTSAVLPAIGHSSGMNLVSLTPTAPGPSPGYDLFKKELLSLGSAVQKPAQYVTDTTTMADYDFVTIASLAMTAAKSTDASVWRRDISKVTDPSGTTVYTYAQGVRALKAGKSVRYSGAGGVILFNKYQNAASYITAVRMNDANGQNVIIGNIPAAELLKLEQS